MRGEGMGRRDHDGGWGVGGETMRGEGMGRRDHDGGGRGR